VQALLDPDHVVNVQYGGFTEGVHVNIKLPMLQQLNLPTDNVLSLNVGNQMPDALTAVFSGGQSANLAGDFPGVQWTMAPRGPLGNVLQTLGIDLGQVLDVADGQVTSNSNSLLGQVSSLLQLLTGSSALPVNVQATYGGVTSNTTQATVSH
jgi:hypothetical protein